MIEEGFLKVIYVKTDENLSDGFTKNTESNIYEDHTKVYMDKRPDPDEVLDNVDPEGGIAGEHGKDYEDEYEIEDECRHQPSKCGRVLDGVD